MSNGEELFETRLERFENMVAEMLTILHGEKNLRLVGLIDKVDAVRADVMIEVVKLQAQILTIQKEVEEIKLGTNKWRYMVWGAGFGAIVVLAIIFGLSLKDIRSFIGK